MAAEVDSQGNLDRVTRPDEASLTQKTSRGFVWMLIQTVGTKCVNLGGQLLLWWLLLPEHFGLFGMVVTVTVFAGFVQQAGIREILIARGRRFHVWASAAFWMSLATGLMGGGILAAASPVVARIYGSDELVGLILVMALFHPLASIGQVCEARLQVELRFRAVAAVEFGRTTGLMLLTVLLAWTGFGAYSFALPWPIMGLARSIALWRLAPIAVRRRPELRRWWLMLSDSGRLIAGACLHALMLQSALIVLSLSWLEESTVGYYVVASSLSVQTGTLLALTLSKVLLPSLSKLQRAPERQREGFLRAMRLLYCLGAPIALLIAAAADPALKALAPARLHAAIPLVAILSVAMALRLGDGGSGSLIKAQGNFHTFMGLYGVWSMLSLLAGAIGLLLGEVVGVATAAAVIAGLLGPVNMYAAVRPIGGRWADIGRVYGPPLIVAAGAAVLGRLAAALTPESIQAGRHVARLALTVLVGGGAYLVLICWITPRTVHDLLEQITEQTQPFPQGRRVARLVVTIAGRINPRLRNVAG